MGEAFEYNEIDLTEPTRSYKDVVMILCLLYFRRWNFSSEVLDLPNISQKN